MSKQKTYPINSTDSYCILIWKFAYNKEYFSTSELYAWANSLPFKINMVSLRSEFYRLVHKNSWFKRFKRHSDRPGIAGYNYRLKERVEHPGKHITMEAYLVEYEDNYNDQTDDTIEDVKSRIKSNKLALNSINSTFVINGVRYTNTNLNRINNM